MADNKMKNQKNGAYKSNRGKRSKPAPNQDRRGSKQGRRAAEIENTAAQMSPTNPVAEYKKFSQFASDAAKLPFTLPVGAPISLGDDTWGIAGEEQGNKYVVPGVLRIRFTPTIGISKDFSSPINRSSIRFYTYLRSNMKASSKYDHQDVTMMLMALDSCYMFHALLRKIYSQMNLFTPANEYFPRAIVSACGADFDDIQKHLQDLRGYINAFGYSLGQFAMPQSFAMFDRHRWMCEGVYTDSLTTKAQVYVFVPTLFWKYDNTVETGSQLTQLQWLGNTESGQKYTYDQIVAIGNSLINAITGDEDFALISGDIYSFYGGRTYELPYVTEDYAVLPSYDKTVLSQIENATVVGFLQSSAVISQNPTVNNGAIIFDPHLTAKSVIEQAFGEEGFIEMNFHWDSPTPDDVLEATRLMAATYVEEDSSGAPSAWKLRTCGTEIVNALDIISRNPATMRFRFLEIGGSVFTFTANSALDSMLVSELAKVNYLQQFDWAPNVRSYVVQTDGKSKALLGMTWDVDNFDMVPISYLENINLAVLLSLFTVDG